MITGLKVETIEQRKCGLLIDFIMKKKADDRMKQEKSCGAVVFSKTDGTTKYLLIQHVNGGHWSFPKGHVEDGETESQTALREIREETGLTVSLDTGFCWVNAYSPSEGVHKDVVYFVAQADDRNYKTQKEEILSAGWYSFDEAQKLITYPNDVSLFKEAVAYLKNRGIA